MRYARKVPDVSDILPSVRQRGVLQPVIVRPQSRVEPDDERAPDGFEIVAGARRFVAARIVADERIATGEAGPPAPLPCAILDSGDEADAVEASLIENLARLDADEVTPWVTFTRLVKEGRDPADIGATFGLPDLAVRRILALGNLLPRIRALYARAQLDRVTVRHLTLASKRQQHAWLALVDDPEQRAPTGAALKAWLFGGQSIAASVALFDVDGSGLETVADRFGEDRYFADASAFWVAQDAAIEARRAAYLADGWGEVVIVPQAEYFQTWEYERMPKRKGGRVYIDVRATGEVSFHEGYVSRREAARVTRDRVSADEKPSRAEITSACQTYVDLHRHAAVRAALTDYPGVALRLVTAHLIHGSPLWTVRREPQATRDDAVRESVEICRGETVFDARQRGVLAALGMDPERTTVLDSSGDDITLVRLFLRLLDQSDAVVLGALAVGMALGIDMAEWWQPDPAFFDLVRDKLVLGAMVADVAGDTVAAANANENGATLQRIVTDHFDGTGGRSKVERWVPRWLAFSPSAYTPRGGVCTVRLHAGVVAAKRELADDQGGDPVAQCPSPDPHEAITPAALTHEIAGGGVRRRPLSRP